MGGVEWAEMAAGEGGPVFCMDEEVRPHLVEGEGSSAGYNAK